jgi:hypothetical protein
MLVPAHTAIFRKGICAGRVRMKILKLTFGDGKVGLPLHCAIYAGDWCRKIAPICPMVDTKAEPMFAACECVLEPCGPILLQFILFLNNGGSRSDDRFVLLIAQIVRKRKVIKSASAYRLIL